MTPTTPGGHGHLESRVNTEHCATLWDTGDVLDQQYCPLPLLLPEDSRGAPCVRRKVDERLQRGYLWASAGIDSWNKDGVGGMGVCEGAWVWAAMRPWHEGRWPHSYGHTQLQWDKEAG